MHKNNLQSRFRRCLSGGLCIILKRNEPVDFNKMIIERWVRFIIVLVCSKFFDLKVFVYHFISYKI